MYDPEYTRKFYNAYGDSEWARLERTEGEVEAAARDFEKVVHGDPTWAQPHVELAALYFRLNRQEDGERERAIFDRLTAEQQK